MHAWQFFNTKARANSVKIDNDRISELCDENNMAVFNEFMHMSSALFNYFLRAHWQKQWKDLAVFDGWEQTYQQLWARAVCVRSVWTQSSAAGSVSELLRCPRWRARLCPEAFLWEKHSERGPAYWSEERLHSAGTNPPPSALKQSIEHPIRDFHF